MAANQRVLLVVAILIFAGLSVLILPADGAAAQTRPANTEQTKEKICAAGPAVRRPGIDD